MLRTIQRRLLLPYQRRDAQVLQDVQEKSRGSAVFQCYAMTRQVVPGLGQAWRATSDMRL